MKLPKINYDNLAQAFSSNLGVFSSRGEESATGQTQVGQTELIALISSGMQRLEKIQQSSGILVSVDDRSTSLIQSFLSEQAKISGKVSDSSDDPEVQFDSGDILGWAGSLRDWLGGLSKHPFLTNSSPPLKIKNGFRAAVLGDWGTGLYGAPVCSASIEADGKFDALLHLGDVYYSGTSEEVQERFLNLWPAVPNAINRALNSNHEMYSGGKGYFKKTLSAFNQSASYFALENDYWVLAGLDTGYEDHDLFGDQLKWLTNICRNLGDRRLVIFSHHQPFSLFESQGEKLLFQLSAILEKQLIYAWYWGHEHRCVIYDRHPIWGLWGRCIGHSGFPYFRDFADATSNSPRWVNCKGKNLVPTGLVLDGPNEHISDNGADYGPNGYLELEFTDKILVERYRAANGALLKEISVS